MSRLEHTDMILYNDTILNKLNITRNAKYKNKKNGQDLIMTRDKIDMFKHFDISTKAKLRTIK